MEKCRPTILKKISGVNSVVQKNSTQKSRKDRLIGSVLNKNKIKSEYFLDYAWFASSGNADSPIWFVNFPLHHLKVKLVTVKY